MGMLRCLGHPGAGEPDPTRAKAVWGWAVRVLAREGAQCGRGSQPQEEQLEQQ